MKEAKKMKRNVFEKFAALFIILTFIVSYFAILPTVMACGTPKEIESNPLGCGDTILGEAKKELGTEHTLVDELNKLINENAQLKSDLSSTNSKIADLQTELERLRGERDGLSSVTDPKYNDLTDKIASNEKELETAKKAKDNIEKTKIPENEKDLGNKAIQTEKEIKLKAKVKTGFYQDPVDLIFTLASMVRAGILTAEVLSRAGGAGTCSFEKPLPGNSSCKSCNEDPYRLCTRERCNILGTACVAVLVENKTDQYRCEPGPCEEIGDIYLNSIQAHWYIDTQEANSSPKTSTTGKQPGTVVLDLGEIEWNTRNIVVNVTTQQLAQCRWILDKPGSNFSEMTDFEDNYFPESAGEPAPQEAVVEVAGDISRNATHTIYVKCNNICNLPHEASYDFNQVKFKLKQKPDQLPPEIVYIDPENHAVVRGDLKLINASFWLDELGRCKFSDKSNNFTKNYSLMIPFAPFNNENSSIINGKCDVGKCLDRNEQCSRCWLLLNTSRGYDIINYSSEEFNETKLFHMLIRCNDTQGNVMLEDNILDYSIMTAPVYNISIIQPEEGNRTYDRQPEIEVTSEPRLTECRYKTYQGLGPKTPPAWDNMTAIDTEFAILHKGKHNETLNATKEGLLHTMWAKCRDTWRIEETDYVRFYTLLDPDAPIIVRMYHDSAAGDFLLVETDEESECVYGISDTIKCNYNFSDGSAFTTSDNYIHAAYWQLSNLYYIKCKDKWNNYPGGSSNANKCTAIINPYEVPPL